MAPMIKTTLEQFRDEVEDFLDRSRRYGMTPTTLGRETINDSSFYSRLRNGADFRTSTIDKVRDYMREWEQSNMPKEGN